MTASLRYQDPAILLEETEDLGYFHIVSIYGRAPRILDLDAGV